MRASLGLASLILEILDPLLEKCSCIVDCVIPIEAAYNQKNIVNQRFTFWSIQGLRSVSQMQRMHVKKLSFEFHFPPVLQFFPLFLKSIII